MGTDLILYSYFRSSASYRVRIGLHLKNIPFSTEPVHLVKDGGQQYQEHFTKINPQQCVPALETTDGIITQSTAILEYLEAKYPQPSLYVGDIAKDSFIRQICNLIACDIHPLNNLRVLTYLTQELEINQTAKNAWYQKWVKDGFKTIETWLEQSPHHIGRYAVGDHISMADLFIVPQIYNAHRFHIDMSDFPILQSIHKLCLAHPAFIAACPENQPDTPADMRLKDLTKGD